MLFAPRGKHITTKVTTGMKKRTRTDESDSDLEMGIHNASSDGIMAPLDTSASFAADRTNNQRNKRPRLDVPDYSGTMPLPGWDTVAYTQHQRRAPVISGTNDAGKDDSATVRARIRALPSPPASPISGLSSHTSSQNALRAVSERLESPISRKRDARSPSLAQSKSVLENEEDDNSYDPDEVHMYNEPSSDSDTEEQNISSQMAGYVGDKSLETKGSTSAVGLTGINAFLHDLHFAHRRQRPPLSPKSPNSSSSAVTMEGHQTRMHTPTIPSRLKQSTLPPQSLSNALASSPLSKAAEAARTAQTRRAHLANCKTVPALSSTSTPQMEDLKNISLQYEETNRLLGSLFLSRRRETGHNADDSDDDRL